MSILTRTATVLTAAVLLGPLASVASAAPLVRSTTNCALTDVSPMANQCFGWYNGNTSNFIPEILALLGGAYTGSTWANGGKTDAGNNNGGPFKPYQNNIKDFADPDLEFMIPQSGLFAVALKAGNEFGIYVFQTGTPINALSINTPNNADVSNAMLFTSTGFPDPNVVVPEPSTYAMMLVGLAGMGVAARRRRKV